MPFIWETISGADFLTSARTPFAVTFAVFIRFDKASVPALSNSGAFFVMPCPIAVTILAPAFINLGRFLVTTCIALGMIFSDPFSTSFATPSRDFSTRGIMLSPAVSTLSTKSSISLSKSWLSSDTPTIRFCHAAFTDFTEPCIVVADSFAVVPVISNSLCTTCIALIMSDRLEISYFTPDNLSASARRRFISSFVPP